MIILCLDGDCDGDELAVVVAVVAAVGVAVAVAATFANDDLCTDGDRISLFNCVVICCWSNCSCNGCCCCC